MRILTRTPQIITLSIGVGTIVQPHGIVTLVFARCISFLFFSFCVLGLCVWGGGYILIYSNLGVVKAEDEVVFTGESLGGWVGERYSSSDGI